MTSTERARATERRVRVKQNSNHPPRTGTGGAGTLGRKLVFDAAGVPGRLPLRIFCHQCRCAFIVAASAAMPGSKLECSLTLPTKLPLPTLLSTDRRPFAPSPDESFAASSNGCGESVRSRGGDVGGA